MTFWIKKIVLLFAAPLPLAMLLLAAALVLLWTGRRHRLGLWLATASFVLLVLFGFWPLPSGAMWQLERTYPALLTPEAGVARPPEVIVVLGGGVSDDHGIPPHDRLSWSALSRVVEGVRLARSFPEARLLFMGGSVTNDEPEAAVMRRVARDLGVAAERIDVETASRDTDDQARHAGRTLAGRRVVLVTSAFHMPRALALFEAHGLAPVPAPTGYFVDEESGVDLWDFAPSGADLELSQLVMKEWLGRAWMAVR